MEEKAVSDETTDDIPELEENDVKEILHELLNELLLKGQEIGNSGDGEAVKHPVGGIQRHLFDLTDIFSIVALYFLTFDRSPQYSRSFSAAATITSPYLYYLLYL